MRDAIDGVRDAYAMQRVVRIVREQIEDDGVEIYGVVVAYSEQLAMIRALDVAHELDGFEVIHVDDITEIDLEFKPAFYRALSDLSGPSPHVAPRPALEDLRSLLEWTSVSYALMGIAREFTEPDELSVGRVQLLTDESLVLRRINRWAEPLPRSEVWSLAEITSVSFGSRYLHLLSELAVRLGSFEDA